MTHRDLAFLEGTTGTSVKEVGGPVIWDLGLPVRFGAHYLP